MLERAGYVVTAQTSSLEAWPNSKEPGKYDLVITDLTMPHLTGENLACELLKVRPDLPFILATGFGGSISKLKPGSRRP